MNVLWISLEDTSPRFGCYGDAIARTPNLDALAERGRLYTRAFSTAGVCAPARAAIITGCYATWLGAHQMRASSANRRELGMCDPYECVPPPYVKCFPEYLRAAGYFCTNNSKTDYQFTPPISAWDECNGKAHWRNREHPDQPFFAVFNPTWTHESGMWPDEEKRRDVEAVTDPASVEVPPFLPDTPLVRTTIARQYDNIARDDAYVGEILAQLEEDGLTQDTAVFIWSDHGEGLPRAKRWPYDSGVRVPLIAVWPEHLNAGETCDDLVSTLDLAPTLFSMLELPIPAHFQGAPFLGPKARPRQYIFAHRDRHDEMLDQVRAVRDARWKYIRHFLPGTPYFGWNPYRNKHEAMQELWRLHREDRLEGAPQKLFEPRPPEELYDTQTDPHETHNLADDPNHTATLDRLRGEMDAWRQKYDPWGDRPESEMREQMWPGGPQPQTAPVHFAPYAPGVNGLDLENEGSFEAPAILQFHCATPGASMVYALEEGDEATWRLYTEPLRLNAGATHVRAKAIRIGYRESEETVFVGDKGDRRRGRQ